MVRSDLSSEIRTQNLRPPSGREVRKRDLQDQTGRDLAFSPNRQKYLFEIVAQAGVFGSGPLGKQSSFAPVQPGHPVGRPDFGAGRIGVHQGVRTEQLVEHCHIVVKRMPDCRSTGI